MVRKRVPARNREPGAIPVIQHMRGAYPNASDEPLIFMPGLVPGIHVFAPTIKKDVDGRDKPGHDEK